MTQNYNESMRVITNTQCVLIDSYVNGTSWYRVYSDGWCEQGGRQWFPDIWTLTFLVPFKNTYYNLQGENQGTDCSANLGTNTYYTTHASGNIQGTRGAECVWEAKGYINLEAFKSLNS